MKLAAVYLLAICLLSSCGKEGKNKVYFLGTVHKQHVNSLNYSLNDLEEIVEHIQPDVILAEIPPHLVAKALEQYIKIDSIVEMRVAQLPEYTEVVIPYSVANDIPIVGVSAWTATMAKNRRDKMQQVKRDTAMKRWLKQYRLASRESNNVMKSFGADDDPALIHTERYDSITRLWTDVYVDKFDAYLEEGSWTEINKSHYALIETALDSLENQGLKILVVFGAAHKSWILPKLKERTDIELADMYSIMSDLNKGATQNIE